VAQPTASPLIRLVITSGAIRRGFAYGNPSGLTPPLAVGTAILATSLHHS
jgi:hypothetical protein